MVWWGHDSATRFDMGPKFKPIAGAQGWQISNPPILSTAPLLASLDIFQRAGIGRLREKSIALKFLLTKLDADIGKRVSATGLLIGVGGVGGLNVSTVTKVADSCP